MEFRKRYKDLNLIPKRYGRIILPIIIILLVCLAFQEIYSTNKPKIDSDHHKPYEKFILETTKDKEGFQKVDSKKPLNKVHVFSPRPKSTPKTANNEEHIDKVEQTNNIHVKTAKKVASKKKNSSRAVKVNSTDIKEKPTNAKQSPESKNETSSECESKNGTPSESPAKSSSPSKQTHLPNHEVKKESFKQKPNVHDVSDRSKKSSDSDLLYDAKKRTDEKDPKPKGKKAYVNPSDGFSPPIINVGQNPDPKKHNDPPVSAEREVPKKDPIYNIENARVDPNSRSPDNDEYAGADIGNGSHTNHVTKDKVINPKARDMKSIKTIKITAKASHKITTEHYNQEKPIVISQEAKSVIEKAIDFSQITPVHPIPKMIHQIIFSGRLKSSEKQKSKRLISQNLDFKYLLWNQQDIDMFVLKYHPYYYKKFNSLEVQETKDQLSIFLILLTFGGYYQDLDVYSQKTLNQWNVKYDVSDVSLIVWQFPSTETSHYIFGELMLASSPGHPLISEALYRIFKYLIVNELDSVGDIWSDVIARHIGSNYQPSKVLYGDVYLVLVD